MSGKAYSFLNRDLSWLSFNYRVLLEAADETVPLYNRIAFLAIFSSNLDEFFRVRMPAIFAFTDIEHKKISIRDEYPKDLAQQVHSILHRQMQDYGAVLTDQVLPALRQNGIQLYYGEPILPEHKPAVREYFLSRVLSFLQPVFLKKDTRNEIFLENNVLYFLVEMESMDGAGKKRFAVLNIPTVSLSGFIVLPPGNGNF